MKVKKRDGSFEEIKLEKIEKRINNLKYIEGIDSSPIEIDHAPISQKVVEGLYDGVTTIELDELAARTAESLSLKHPDYSKIAAKIEVSRLHKECSDLGSFEDKMIHLYYNGNISFEFMKYVVDNASSLVSMIDYSRDYLIDYFGLSTLKKSYLLKDKDKKIIETPQDMWMRVAAFINQGDLEATKRCYDLMSQKYYTHATPTLFNAGTIRPQLSSCFLLDIHDDSIGGIYKTLSDTAAISQHAGGIGMAVHKIRSEGSHINGTNGTSNGIVPMLRVFNETARYVDQGGGKRKGSFAIYLEPWHADIEDFLELRKNHGKEEFRTRDLFTALWIPDLFMQRVKNDEEWTLFDPKKSRVKEEFQKIRSRSFEETFGKDFERLYTSLEESRQGDRTIRARDLWDKIIESQIETGTPYMLYKDAVNEKCNQKNLGTIKSSNLCTEITEYTSHDEQAVCNLASISLPSFVEDDRYYNYDKLYEVSKEVTFNLNKVIDLNYYPTDETKKSNLAHRPIGIGVQGLADVFARLGLPFGSEESREINKRIFESIYKGAIDASIELARKNGSYSSYEGSPASNGLLQFDLWGIDRDSLKLDWGGTFKSLHKYGLRNSLLLAPMPTASTSQILGNNECFEPFTSNIYKRRTLSGTFKVINKHLVKDLQDLNLWTESIVNQIIEDDGSIQNISLIPNNIKEIYKTVWEIPMKDVIDMAADRGAFICQSQSMNLWLSDPNIAQMSSMHFYAWEKGLKTGMYYLRTKAALEAIKGLGVDTPKEPIIKEIESIVCSVDDPDCEACGS